MTGSRKQSPCAVSKLGRSDGSGVVSMAKKSAVEKNNQRKALVARYAEKRKALLAIANNEALEMEERFAARLKLAELPRNSSATRIRNRCFMTGRPRANYQKMG